MTLEDNLSYILECYTWAHPLALLNRRESENWRWMARRTPNRRVVKVNVFTLTTRHWAAHQLESAVEAGIAEDSMIEISYMDKRSRYIAWPRIRRDSQETAQRRVVRVRYFTLNTRRSIAGLQK